MISYNLVSRRLLVYHPWSFWKTTAYRGFYWDVPWCTPFIPWKTGTFGSEGWQTWQPPCDFTTGWFSKCKSQPGEASVTESRGGIGQRSCGLRRAEFCWLMVLTIYGRFSPLVGMILPTDWYCSKWLKTSTNIFWWPWSKPEFPLRSTHSQHIHCFVLLMLHAFLLNQPPVWVGSSPSCMVKPPFSHFRWQWERSSYLSYFNILQSRDFGGIIS